MALNVQTERWRTGKAQFDMVGRFLGYPMKRIEGSISPGMSDRLMRFGSRCLEEYGFPIAIFDTATIAYDVSDDIYRIEFKTPQGGVMQLNGIMTKHGYPFVHHGFTVYQISQTS